MAQIRQKYQQQMQMRLEIYERWLQVPSSVPLTRGGILGGASPDLRRLRRLAAILPDKKDAEHIVAARRAGLDYFVTTDEHTILKHSGVLEHEGIAAVLPSKLVAILSGA